MTKTIETKRVPTVSVDVRGMYRNAVSEQPTEESFIGADAAWLSLAFSNGEKIEFSTNRLGPDLMIRAAAHGLKQKLVDAAAISRDPETGRSATVEQKIAAVKKVYDRIMGGLWNEPREGGGSGSYLLRALCKLNPTRTAEALKEWLDGKTDEQKKALELNPRIAEAILAIKSEKLGADDIDTDELLDELLDELGA